MDVKTEIKQETFDTDNGLQNEILFPSKHMTKVTNNIDTCCNVSVMDTKVEVKEEPWWQIQSLEIKRQVEASPISNLEVQTETRDVADDFAVAEYPGLGTGEADNTNSAGPTLFTTKDLEERHKFEFVNVSIDESCGSNVMETSCSEQSVNIPKTKESYNCKQIGEVINANGKSAYLCKICETHFDCTETLKRHVLIHKSKRLYQCEVCEKSFARKWYLNTHILIHEGKKPYKCEVCEKSFTRRWDLHMHILIHKSKRPYKCEVCEKTFIKRWCLNAHILSHEGKRPKPYSCDICKNSFTRRWDLNRHILIHEGKKPYKCNICEKTFTQGGVLKRHILNHEGKKPYTCDFCEKSFSVRKDLETHTLIHEGNMP